MLRFSFVSSFIPGCMSWPDQGQGNTESLQQMIHINSMKKASKGHMKSMIMHHILCS